MQDRPPPPHSPEETPPDTEEFTSEAEVTANAQQVQPSGPRGTWAGRWRVLSRLPLTLMITSVLLGLGIVQLTFQLGNTVYRTVTWQQETRQTSARVRSLQRDVNILRDAEKAASDPVYLEQLARCQGFVRRSESVIVAENAPTTPSENCQVIRLP